jgi:hypothetical protein
MMLRVLRLGGPTRRAPLNSSDLFPLERLMHPRSTGISATS